MVRILNIANQQGIKRHLDIWVPWIVAWKFDCHYRKQKQKWYIENKNM